MHSRPDDGIFVDGLRTEMAATHFSMLKCAFVFWIGQFAAVGAMMAFLLRLYR